METTQTSSFFDQITKVKRELIAGVLIIFVAGLGFAIYTHLEEKKEYVASQDYFAITQSWKNKEKPLENLNDDTTRSQLESFLEKHKNTSSALYAAILLADHYGEKSNEEMALK
ncbi:MAG: tetratricopeptide repeat protein, partial [Bdellovibrionales bacterium]|nr:tetratricopeptide repeat protein [Bdellovibrionales bacterium]